jgi:hypothetical protein
MELLDWLNIQQWYAEKNQGVVKFAGVFELYQGFFIAVFGTSADLLKPEKVKTAKTAQT